MEKSIFFNEDDIIETSSYRTAVNPSAFLQKVEDICVYEQDYTYSKVVDLGLAEEALLILKKLFK